MKGCRDREFSIVMDLDSDEKKKTLGIWGVTRISFLFFFKKKIPIFFNIIC